jgi:cell division protein FtsI/penicillin-binding protein 2
MSGVRRIIRSTTVLIALGAAIACCASAAQSWQSAADEASWMAPDARIVVLDVKSGSLLAARHRDEVARTLAAPGSTLKPLVLYALLSAGQWNAEQRVACDRRLNVAGHRLACTHPAAPPFDAREALTWSCNSYFAAVARSLPAGELGLLLRPSGLLDTTGLAPTEAIATFREPHTAEERELALLGVQRIRVTPLELAEAYRWLVQQLSEHRGSESAELVRAALRDSASFGMAAAAGMSGVQIAGKTGTAEGTASSQTHGWFAGFAPADDPQVVVVAYVPAGRGADAAHVASEVLKYAPPFSNAMERR